MPPLTALAPAKINLFLHVGPVDADGYHPLSSLVAFAEVGDRVTVEPADRLSLSVSGPFGAGLAAEPDNLILRALRALGQATGTGEPPLRVTLDKRLPIAAGLGGGSSDAGAALKLARQALALDIDDVELEAVAGVIGADGRVRAVGATPGVALARMSGSGATVFGLCRSGEDAAAAAAALSAAHPAAWVAATRLAAA